MDRIIEELSVHAAIEESLFYPATRVLVPDTEDVALESLEEHHVVKVLLAELEKMDPKDERFVAKTTVLIESVRHHVEEEEDEYFPKVREALGRNALSELVNQIDAACHVDVDNVVASGGQGPEGPVYAFLVTWACPDAVGA